MSKCSLIIVSHGSRVEEANREMMDFSKQIDDNARDHFSSVKHAFLEVAHPTLSEQVEKLVNDGVEQILVLPLFLAAGKHVNVDIPELIEGLRKEYSAVSFKVMDHIGSAEPLKTLILSEAIAVFKG